MSEARDTIFAAIRGALGSLADTPADEIRREAARLLETPERVRPILPEGTAVELFVAAVKRLPPGASVERVLDISAVPAAVAAHLQRLGISGLARIQPVAPLAGLDWHSAGISVTETVDEGVAVTFVETGIAETASLVVRSGPASAILDSILPLHHVAVLPASGIVRHLDEAFSPADLKAGRNVMIVTGPSGTTDIEGNLVIGVHGPRTLHVVIVG
ncbi:LutC/YkgG family protein [Mangrovicella endophytica]|uniref:LutC/YkgG family protein n=1 Tax=Mangrovicella endophytica TaxID=2066697 RepID=UPI000C9DD339|nr:LUD domain-containing protein [Mangrovicella endophytica]